MAGIPVCVVKGDIQLQLLLGIFVQITESEKEKKKFTRLNCVAVFVQAPEV